MSRVKTAHEIDHEGVKRAIELGRWKAARLIRRSCDLSRSEVLILWELVDGFMSDETILAWPSKVRLAGYTALSSTAVTTAFRRLMERGVLFECDAIVGSRNRRRKAWTLAIPDELIGGDHAKNQSTLEISEKDKFGTNMGQSRDRCDNVTASEDRNDAKIQSQLGNSAMSKNQSQLGKFDANDLGINAGQSRDTVSDECENSKFRESKNPSQLGFIKNKIGTRADAPLGARPHYTEFGDLTPVGDSLLGADLAALGVKLNSGTVSVFVEDRPHDEVGLDFEPCSIKFWLPRTAVKIRISQPQSGDENTY